MERKNLLVTVAHPDDETFFMGGTIANYCKENVDSTIVFLTNGDKGKNTKRDPLSGLIEYEEVTDYSLFADTRRKECMDAADKLGVKDLIFVDEPDQGLDLTIVPKIKDIIKRIDPQVILSFGEAGTTLHPDHQYCGIATFQAVKELIGEYYGVEAETGPLPFKPDFSFRKLLSYHMPNSFEFLQKYSEMNLNQNELTSIDITGVIGRKRLAAYEHRSQTHLADFFERVGLLGRAYENFYERIYVGDSAKNCADIFSGIDGDSRNLFLPTMLEPKERYISSDLSFYNDLLAKATPSADSRQIKQKVIGFQTSLT